MVTRDIGRLIGLGLALGLAASFALSRYLESLLFNQEPNDPWTLAAACLLVILTGFVTALVPMRRAARVDPVVVLRNE
ncbi:FtsX-like permease family protein [compost metagenome]